MILASNYFWWNFSFLYYPPGKCFPFIAELYPLLHLWFFFFGACMGSFINVCVWRLPRDESVIWAQSHCPKCNHNLAWFENIPLFSWACLLGRCRSCKDWISWRYWSVELATGTLIWLAWYKVLLYQEPVILLFTYSIVIFLVVATTLIDAEHFIIPNEITYPVIFLGLLLSLFFPEYWGPAPISRLTAFTRSCAGVVAGGGTFAILAVLGQYLFKQEALGWGDVKYLAAVGACLGITGCFFTVLFGSMLGSIVGIAMIVLKGRKIRSVIPFGPFLAAGTYIWMMFGDKIIFWYLDFLKQLSGGMGA